ncbi:hypothetical protein PPMP20_13305 [Paraburkholderia phymatum]|uniref:Uncharacterized protein n=1 Tax=Paraburkholderia phymatum (strain DSM 17167 / CIP 108236 / LMG 21445 / STM815) TaxID=391038 RepID=B2JEA6_PARP8|nr:hypothetical protein [Paraburkholderia phymatum]ACC71314.1 hypothetical protein Bphy_2139 [Paraburkholderia phymatum STM815]
MDLYLTSSAGSFKSTLIDQDIAHIARVMRPSMHGDLGGAILPADYWRRRLFDLLEAEHLTNSQLCAIDDLLLQLDDLSSKELAPLPVPTARPAASRDASRHRVRRQR